MAEDSSRITAPVLTQYSWWPRLCILQLIQNIPPLLLSCSHLESTLKHALKFERARLVRSREMWGICFFFKVCVLTLLVHLSAKFSLFSGLIIASSSIRCSVSEQAALLQNNSNTQTLSQSNMLSDWLRVPGREAYEALTALFSRVCVFSCTV